jgi:hypothetical protein
MSRGWSIYALRRFRSIVCKTKDTRALNLRIDDNGAVDRRFLFRIDLSFSRLVLLSRVCFFLELLLVAWQLEFEHACARGDFGLETVIIDVEVQSPDTRQFFNSTPAFPAFKGETSILAGAVKGACPVGLCVSTNPIPNFMRIAVDIYPVHDGRSVRDGRDEPLILGIWIGQIVSCIPVAKGTPIFSSTVDPQLSVPQDNRAPVDFSAASWWCNAIGNQVAAACPVLLSLVFGLALANGFLASE